VFEMPLEPLHKRSNSHRGGLGLDEVRARHRRVLLWLKQLALRAQLGDLGLSFRAQYESFVDCVWATFDAEARLLKSLADPRYLDHSCAHRVILRQLADACESLRTDSAIPPAEFLHCLDALVVHVTVDSAVFAQLDTISESDRAPSRTAA
jgi:hypothetical protein